CDAGLQLPYVKFIGATCIGCGDDTHPTNFSCGTQDSTYDAISPHCRTDNTLTNDRYYYVRGVTLCFCGTGGGAMASATVSESDRWGDSFTGALWFCGSATP